jgi:hypothetical protein
MTPVGELTAGEVGYMATGLKTVRECRVGDTITCADRPAAEPLPGYKPVKPMVFAGLYPSEGEDYPLLQGCAGAAATQRRLAGHSAGTSTALNFGFRCGFLGLFHMEIIQERLEREYDLDLVATAPSVEYEVVMTRRRRSASSKARPTCPTNRPSSKSASRGCTCRFSPRTEYYRRGDGPGDANGAASSWQAGISRAGPRRAALLPAAGRDDRRLLRQAQERHARLRLDGLRIPRATAPPIW